MKTPGRDRGLEERHARQIRRGTAAPFGAQAFQPAEKVRDRETADCLYRM